MSHGTKKPASPRLSDSDRARIQEELDRAEFWAANMDQHGQANTVHHENAIRLRAALAEDSTESEGSE